MKNGIYEDYAIVLDYLPTGRVTEGRPSYKREPLIQALGEKYLTLLELIPKEGVSIKIGERLFIGKGERDKIKYVKGLISYDKLTHLARSELEEVVKKLVEENENRFVEFFNKCGPLTPRLHQLELLPGIGKKLMWEILEERKKAPFKNFEDLSQRIKSIPDPKKMIVKRILEELKGDTKHNIFVRRVIHKREV